MVLSEFELKSRYGEIKEIAKSCEGCEFEREIRRVIGVK